MAFGLQVANYRQLKDAAAFLERHGAKRIASVHADLYPGIDYTAHFLDADGHLIQLYYYMEQVGWDSKPRPHSERHLINGAWPDALEPVSDTYAGEPYLGPWG